MASSESPSNALGLPAKARLVEVSSVPTTAAGEGALFLSDGSGSLSSGVLYFVPESDGEPVPISLSAGLAGTLLHRLQLEAGSTGNIQPAAVFGFDVTVTTNNPSDGDTLIINNGVSVPETFTFRTAPSVAFDVQIDAGDVRNTLTNLATAINTDSTQNRAVKVTDLTRLHFNVATRGHAVVIVSLISAAVGNPRLYGTSAAPSTSRPRSFDFSTDLTRYNVDDLWSFAPDTSDPGTRKWFGYQTDGVAALPTGVLRATASDVALYVRRVTTPTSSTRWIRVGPDGAPVVLTLTSGSASRTLTVSEHSVIATLSGGSTQTVALPAAALVPGEFFAVRRTDADGTSILTLDPFGGELIDGAATKTVNDGEGYLIVSSGTAWHTVASFGTGGGGGDLAATLVLGNTTGGTDIAVSQGDEIVGGVASPGSKVIGGAVSLRGITGDTTSAQATATITVASAPLTAATITIGSTVLTGVAGARTPGANNFDRSLGTTSALATEIAAAINDALNTFDTTPGVTASALGSVVTLTSFVSGTDGNGIALAKTSTPSGGLVLSGSFFSGGWGIHARSYIRVFAALGATGSVVVGGTTLTPVAGARTPGANNFDRTKATVLAQAEEIAEAINDPANTFDTAPGVKARVVAVSATDARAFITANAIGTAGNGITLTETMSGMSSNGSLAGGADPVGPVILNLGVGGSVTLTTDGETRGPQTLDLQFGRTQDNQVARGLRSVVLGGRENTNQQQDGFVAGIHNFLGEGDTVVPSAMFGRRNFLEYGEYGWVVGGSYNYLYGLYGANFGSSLIWGDFHLINTVGAPGFASGALFGSSHQFEAGFFAQTNLVGGYLHEFGFAGGTYLGASIVWGNQHDIQDAQASLISGEVHEIIDAVSTIVVGEAHYVNVPVDGGGIFGSGGEMTNASEFGFAGGTGGPSQNSVNVLGRATTNATLTELIGTSTLSLGRMKIRPNQSWAFRILVSARQTGGAAGTVGDSANWAFYGQIKRDGANNTVMVGVWYLVQTTDGGAATILAHKAHTVAVTPVQSDGGASTWTVLVDADNTNESLRVQVTGEASKNIHWTAVVHTANAGTVLP